MLDDITTTIKAQLYDRVTSPLSGAFAISWSIWNWKFIVILISDLNAIEKLRFISLNIFNSQSAAILNGFLYPLATAIALIYIYPYPAKLLYRVSQNYKKELKAEQQKIEDDTPILQGDALALRKSLREIHLLNDSHFSKHADELALAKATIDEYTSKTIEAKSEISQLEQNLISEKTQKSDTESRNQQLTQKINRLLILIDMAIPLVGYDPEQKVRVFEKLKKPYPDITPSHAPANLEEKGIETNLAQYMNHENYLIQSNPYIFMADEKIYLKTDKSTYLIAKHNTGDTNTTLNTAKTMIKYLHETDKPRIT
ncbi:hypothetical protein [Pseudomonas carnis]|uniref:hypothetical protein n=1 Tax=Pseudomonas carnis TaxID=2487355 RepID=UPI0018E728AF|nr:hypothetical protein [Pseudomonas carnis]MBJ2209676.1 hypothetical protein [Pseudomonas carnis]MDE1529809.1 hypothetical protein [Pseudomonas carnis]